MKNSFVLVALLAVAGAVVNIYLAVFKHAGIESKIYIIHSTVFVCLAFVAMNAFMLERVIELLKNIKNENAK